MPSTIFMLAGAICCTLMPSILALGSMCSLCQNIRSRLASMFRCSIAPVDTAGVGRCRISGDTTLIATGPPIRPAAKLARRDYAPQFRAGWPRRSRRGSVSISVEGPAAPRPKASVSTARAEASAEGDERRAAWGCRSARVSCQLEPGPQRRKAAVGGTKHADLGSASRSSLPGPWNHSFIQITASRRSVRAAASTMVGAPAPLEAACAKIIGITSAPKPASFMNASRRIERLRCLEHFGGEDRTDWQ